MHESSRRSRLPALLIALGLVVCTRQALAASQKPAPTAAPQANQKQNANAIPCPASTSYQITSTMYFLSKPQDAAQCSMSVGSDGRIVSNPAVTNPAMTCPDMYSWKLFTDVVTQQFWKGWAADQQAWPGVPCPDGSSNCKQYSAPLPLCVKPGSSGPCCNPDSKSNPGYNDASNPAKQCPYFPGDHLQANAPMQLRVGQPPSKAHLVSFAVTPEAKATLQSERQLRLAEPGRKIRQSMAELVFRNKPMFDFVFRNNLYNQEGISSVYNNNNNNIFVPSQQSTGMPYRLQNRAGALSEIDFPVESLMIKSNWVARERAAELGLIEDPANPYIKMTINSPVTDNNGTILAPGEHWLVAMHISSKDTPNWVWTTFEHVNNPGRCDYTGCNDSYGYSSPDQVKAGQATNFTTPHMKCDELRIPSFVFENGKRYDGGIVSPGLNAVLTRLDIGKPGQPTNCNVQGPGGQPICMPSPADTAWRSYRLKGSQVNFTDSMGRPTRLGNSVTEGGFVNTSSCISCHARAGTTGTGTLPPALGVFVNELSQEGYGQSHFGVPVADWYHHSGQPPTLNVLQTDFVWGFLTANPLTLDKAQAKIKATISPLPAENMNSVRGRRDMLPPAN